MSAHVVLRSAAHTTAAHNESNARLRLHANPLLHRPASAQEMAQERSTSVLQCNEALREVTLYQNAGGKSLSRTFRYDKVRMKEGRRSGVNAEQQASRKPCFAVGYGGNSAAPAGRRRSQAAAGGSLGRC